MEIYNKTTWNAGIDVGQGSMGLEVVETEDKDCPKRILTAATWIHDGGSSDASTGQSRKAKAGELRRSRDGERHRKARMKNLQKVLESLSIPVPDSDTLTSDTNAPITVEPWEDRKLLVEGKIADEDEMKMHLGRAVMHIAKRRGWRNPWLSVEQLKQCETPSESFKKIRSHASQIFGVDEAAITTVGQIGYLAVTTPQESKASPYLRFRPRPDKKGALTDGGLLLDKLKQEDLVAELRLICKIQELSDDVFEKLCTAIFTQKAPKVSLTSIGSDPFDESQPRASMATLEFQEFRIRDKVSNLRILRNGEAVKLTPEQHSAVVKLLLEWDEVEYPTWGEIADLLVLSEQDTLVTDSSDKSNSHQAPIDRTSRMLQHSELSAWWKTASPKDRADFVDEWIYYKLIAEEDLDETIDAKDSIVKTVWQGLSLKGRTALEDLNFTSGRSAYGRESLQKMNEAMAEHLCDQTTARWYAFKDVMGWQNEEEAKSWTPPKSTFDQLTGNPTVDANIALVRRFMETATKKWGPPSVVVIEHSRDGFTTPQKVLEQIALQNSRRRDNDKWRKELEDSGKVVSHDNIRRFKLLARQKGECLYCGTPIGFDTSEIDHIVCQSKGRGSNRESNLVLACQTCNGEKNDKPFGLWAEGNNRGVTLEATIERVKNWEKVGLQEMGSTTNKHRQQHGKQPINVYAKLQKDVIARLERKQNDRSDDDRSMESTSWAALAIRERIEDFLEKQALNYPGYDPKTTKVYLFNGRVTSLAREHSGFNKTVALRGQDKKIRWDRRHHALDAIILSSLTPSIAKTLVERDNMRQAEFFNPTPTNNYLKYHGSTPGDKVLFRRWLKNVKKLAQLTKTALANDRIPVIYVSRMRPYADAKHAASGSKLIKKRLSDPFSTREIRRVTDKYQYIALLNHQDLTKRGSLGANPNRTLILSDGRTLGGNSVIGLYPASKSGRKPKDPSIDPNTPKIGKAAMIKTQRGASELHCVHHARVYAWKNEEPETQTSTYEFGIVRVFAGEFHRMGFLKKGVDVFTKALPVWSESYRLTASSVLAKIEARKAIQVGWLVNGDELEFGKEFLSQPQLSKPKAIEDFVGAFSSDRRWVITGIPVSSALGIRASYLSDEKLDDNLSSFIDVITNGWQASISTIFVDPDLKIIRRSILGVPRWHDTWNQKREKERLPKSWQPHLEAKRLLG
ncbi:type II CRISPR RNA-guided endonuclease Cas9 [Ferrimicrobium acidiphilum]|uniref:type II CRISPR RNA-guided endonuclease Cas9 n=1 Tax=Ferrimicrobium acidiphilum TaxID=121039 RepID=UPI0023F3668B|nr:type II CRISPR RNA-guided endonuclease Cas9 [Ferrimicrobium acidiphilum]